MKKKKKSLLSLNKTRIHNLQQLSRIVGGEETNNCDTRVDECDNTNISDCMHGFEHDIGHVFINE